MVIRQWRHRTGLMYNVQMKYLRKCLRCFAFAPCVAEDQTDLLCVVRMASCGKSVKLEPLLQDQSVEFRATYA